MPVDPKDTDGDGIKDIYETNTGTYVSAEDTGTNPEKADSDGDGFSDGEELAAEADPTDAESVPVTEPEVVINNAAGIDSGGGRTVIGGYLNHSSIGSCVATTHTSIGSNVNRPGLLERLYPNEKITYD